MTRRRKNTAALENKSLQVQEFGHALDLEIKGANDPDDDDVEAVRGRTEALIAQTERMIRDIEQKGSSDTVADMRKRLEALELKASRPPREGRSSLDEDHGEQIETKGGPDPDEYKQALREYFRSGTPLEETLERKDMSTLRGEDGGYLVAPEFQREMEHVIYDMSPIRQIAKVTSTGSKSLKLPAAIEMVSTSWTGEEDEKPATGSPKFDLQEYVVHDQYGRCKLTEDMVDDSMFDIEAEVSDQFSTQFAIQEGNAFVLGDGVKKPRGFLTYDMVPNASWKWGKIGYIKSGSNSGIGAGSAAGDGQDPLTDLTFALKTPFRRNARWVMNSNTAAVVRKMKDSTGRLLWPDGMQEGGLPPLLGYGVTVCEDMPDISSGAYPLAFGDFSRGYLVVDRLETTIRRLDHDPPRVHVYGRRRVGGGVRHYQAIVAMKIAA